jgi:hypothetical protein
MMDETKAYHGFEECWMITQQLPEQVDENRQDRWRTARQREEA